MHEQMKCRCRIDREADLDADSDGCYVGTSVDVSSEPDGLIGSDAWLKENEVDCGQESGVLVNAKEVLTEEQRRRFKRIPEAGEQSAQQYFTFTQAQRDCILMRRRDHNRLGFAVQLALVQYPGWPLPHYESIPPSTLTYIADQIHVSPDVMAQYAKREPTRREHLEEIRRTFGYDNFSAQRYKSLVRLLYAEAWENDNAVELMDIAVRWLRENKIILPAISTIERVVWEAMHRADKKMYSILDASITEEQRRRMDAMLEGQESSRTLAWVRDRTDLHSPEGFLKVAERLGYLRQMELRVDAGAIAPARLRKLIRISAAYEPHLYKRLRPDKKYGLLGLHLQTLAAMLVDRAVYIHDCLITRFISDMAACRRQHGDASVPDGAAALPPSLRTPFKKRYFRFRKYTPVMLELFDFRGNDASSPLLEAIEVLRQMNRSGKRHIAVSEHMLNLVPRRARLLMADDRGAMYGYVFEMAVMVEIRNQLRAGNLWVAGSEAHRPFGQYLLPSGGDGGRRAEPQDERWLEEYLADSRRRLAEQLPLVSHSTGMSAAYLPRDAGEGSGRWTRLNHSLYKRLPGIRLMDLLREVDAWTGFTDRFVHSSTLREPDEAEKHKLWTVLVALGTANGLKNAAGDGAASAASYRQLMNTLQWRVNEETIEQANKALIEYQRGLPLAVHWSESGGISSDVQAVPVVRSTARTLRGEKAGRCYQYRWMNDQFLIVHTEAAPFGDLGLLLNGAASPDTPYSLHYCHASGFADRLFGLSRLLGTRLFPRLRRFHNTRLYRIGRIPTSPFVKPGDIDVAIIREAAAELRQLVQAIRSGTVSASRMFAKVRSRDSLNAALREIGRIEKTLFYTEFIRSRSLHQAMARDAQRWKELYALIRLLTPGGGGSLQGKHAEDQARFLQANSLLVNAIVVWNTVQLERSIRIWKESASVDEEWLKHVSPLYGGHIAL